MKLANPPGAQFEILVDGKPRSYRDIKAVTMPRLNLRAAPGTNLLLDQQRLGDVLGWRRAARRNRSTQPAPGVRRDSRRRTRVDLLLGKLQSRNRIAHARPSSPAEGRRPPVNLKAHIERELPSGLVTLNLLAGVCLSRPCFAWWSV